MNILSNIKGDRVIWVIVLLLSVVSMLAVYSSISTLAYKSGSGNQMIILIKHGITVLLGIMLMYYVHKLKFTYYSRIAQIAFWVSIPLLVLTLIIGTNLNDASRWLVVPGLGISFQTSDLAKVALIMYVARMLSKKQNQIKDFKSAFLPIVVPIITICTLILPANFSTAALLFMVCFILMYVGRINLKYLGAMIGIGIIGVFLIILVGKFAPNLVPRFGTWVSRIENFSSGDKDGNYQANQAKIAIATGGITGKGPGNSTQRNFLPHPYSDFVYAFIIEEYGIFGAVGILLLYMLLLYRTIKIVTKTENTFGGLLALGCGLLIVLQAFINMSVSVGLFPVTGQPLPLVSKGGTSILFSGIAIGIILSVSRSIEENKKGGNVATD
jgi:cell division protein FtsW